MEELLRLVSSPDRRESLDKLFGYEVTLVRGFNNEILFVNLDDYVLLDKKLGVYELKPEHSYNKYRHRRLNGKDTHNKTN